MTKTHFRAVIVRNALVACAVYAGFVAAIAALVRGEGETFASSLLWWLVAIPVGWAWLAALELFGAWSLGLPFWQRMPSSARILLLVAIICLAVLLIVLVFGAVHAA